MPAHQIAPRAPLQVAERPQGLLAARAAPRGAGRAARRAAQALRTDLRQRSRVLVAQPRIEPTPFHRACVQAVRVEPAQRTATAEARAALLTHRERAALTVATPVSSTGGDGLDEVRALLLERSMRALAANEDGLGITGDVDELLRGLLAAAQRAFERRFARSTVQLDKSYWRFWSEWCAMLGTPALRSNQAANSGATPQLHEREVAIALGAFMAWVSENPQYKVESMLARLRGVARRHKSLGLKFVSLSMVVMAAEGLVQEHIDAHGADSLLPRSKEPLTVVEIEAMLDLPEGTTIVFAGGSVAVGDNLEWQGVRVWISLYCVGGFRKEAVAIGRGEVFGFRKLSLANLTYVAEGVVYRAPPPHQLRDMRRVGTAVYITPSPCKNDTTGKKYGNSPIPSPWHPTRKICFAREIIEYELMRGVAAEQRRAAPLVLGPNGASWTKAALDTFFKALILNVASKERAAMLSVHSFRVWLACALLAAKATPEQIMLLLRWSSAEARRLYAREGMQAQATLLAAACNVSLDTVRSHTLLRAAACDACDANAAAKLAAMQRASKEAAEAVDVAQTLLQRAVDHRGDLPAAADLPCSIDDDEVHARVHASLGELHRAAVRADETLRLGDADVDSDEDE